MLKSLPLSEVYKLIEPGPVVLLSTLAKGGRPNVMTMSWHMMMEFEPPQIGCIVSANNFSFEALRATKECVIAIPHVGLADKVVKVGNCSGRDVDKFATCGLKPLAASDVAPKLIADCLANLECRVIDTRMVNKYNLFVLEVVRAWDNPVLKDRKTFHHQGYGTFAVDGQTITLESKMR